MCVFGLCTLLNGVYWTCIFICVYMYIYIYTYVYMHVYVVGASNKFIYGGADGKKRVHSDDRAGTAARANRLHDAQTLVCWVLLFVMIQYISDKKSHSTSGQ